MIVIAVVSMGEVVRSLRDLNVVAGLGVAVLGWLADADVGYGVVLSITGVVVAGLAVPRGRITESYGDWDRFVV